MMTQQFYEHLFFLGRLHLVWLLLLFYASTLRGLVHRDCQDLRLGDKWFDGCQWCMCHVDKVVCTQSLCSPLVYQLPPCTKGAMWHDGCYQCKCSPDGILCTTELSFTTLSLSEDFQSLSRNKLECSKFDKCICGLDGVPMCSAQVFDRSQKNFQTIILQPTTVPTLKSELIKIAPDPRLNNRIPVRKLFPTNDFYKKLKAKRRRSNRNNILDKHSNRRLGLTFDDEQMDSSSLTLVAVSSYRCQLGTRWYAGSLRCYCDNDNSITCGNPSFVAVRIDGLRLKSKFCLAGDVWQEEFSCRQCSCLMDGLVYCSRSSLCPLPLFIEPFDDENLDDIAELTGPDAEHWNSSGTTSGTDSVDHGLYKKWDVSEREKNGGRTSTTKGIQTNITKQHYHNISTSTQHYHNISTTTQHYTSMITTRNISKEIKDLYLTTLVTNTKNSSNNKKNGTLVTVRECIPGTIKHKKCLICDCSIHGTLQCEYNTSCDQGEKTNDKKSETSPRNNFKTSTPLFEVNSTPWSKVTTTPSSKVKSTTLSKLTSTPSSEAISPVQVTSSPTFIPEGKSPYSQRSTLPETRSSFTTSYYTRMPFKTLKPYTVIPGNRDYPITYKPQDTSCGRYKLNEIYREGCNVCICSKAGPKCTAKHCALIYD